MSLALSTKNSNSNRTGEDDYYLFFSRLLVIQKRSKMSCTKVTQMFFLEMGKLCFFFFLSDEIFLSMDCYFSFTKCFDRLCRTRFDNWVAL